MAHRRWFAVMTMMMALVAGSGRRPATAADKAVLSMTGFVVNMSGVGPARAGTLDIVIERWSTDEERERLRSTLIQNGSGALLSALQKIRPRAGYIRSPFSIGWDVHYARQEPLPDGGRRVILATDRPMSFWELTNQPRSAEYQFTLAEIRLNKDGKGEGKIATPAKVSWNREHSTIQITNYGTEPVRLTEVSVN
jgi:hypothetical protein